MLIERKASNPSACLLPGSRRRLFLGAFAGMVGVPLARAQPQRKIARIGYIANGASVAAALPGLQPFVIAMRERGYVLGEHFVFDIRPAGGDARRFAALAEELIALQPDVLLAFEASAIAMSAKTKTIPIVLLSSRDPVAAGLVKSLARPGTNVTGMSGQWSQLLVKQIELLRELVPRASRIVMLSDPFWNARDSNELIASQAATALGMNIEFAYVKDAGEVQQLFAQFERRRPDGLLLIAVGLVLILENSVLEGVRRLRLPTVGQPNAGASVSYSQDLAETFRESADFVDRILKGAKPEDLPVRQSNRFSLTVNMKIAREIDLKIPQSILVRAEQVIE